MGRVEASASAPMMVWHFNLLLFALAYGCVLSLKKSLYVLHYGRPVTDLLCSPWSLQLARLPVS
jgi:hypothetical protein